MAPKRGMNMKRAKISPLSPLSFPEKNRGGGADEGGAVVDKCEGYAVFIAVKPFKGKLLLGVGNLGKGREIKLG